MQKKKIVLITTLLLCLILCCVICLLLPINSTNINADGEAIQSKQDIIGSQDLGKYLSNSSISTQDKSATSVGEEQTAKEYLSPFMAENNLEKFNGENNYWVQFMLGINTYSHNVVGIKKGVPETDKTIILGAHYDNNYKRTNAMGALDNATGVVCLMGIIKALKNVTLNYNIIFCFYGASDNGAYSGSENLYANLDNKTKNNLLLAINFDSIGCGEYTYYYAGDSANSFATIFEPSKHNIQAMPRYSKTNYILSNKHMAYYNAGLNSDNVTYFKNGVRNINFFSGNLNGLVAGFKESSEHDNIAGTKLDNLDTFMAFYPNYNEHLNNVATSVVNALTGSRFLDAIENSNAEIDFSFLNKKVIIFFTGIIGIFLLCGIKEEKTKNKKDEKND